MAPSPFSQVDLSNTAPGTIHGALREYGCLTDTQLAIVMGANPAAVRKQLSRLAGKGRVKRYSRRRGAAGRPTKVTCLPGSQWESACTREHQLELNDLRLVFRTAGPRNPHIQIQTWDIQGIKLKTVGVLDNAKHFCPDAAALLRHPGAARPLAVLIEVDRGTESLSRSTRKQSSWVQKAEAYRDGRLLKRWRAWLTQRAGERQEAALRLAVVTTDGGRMSGIVDTLALAKPALSVWMTTNESLKQSGLGGKIWHRMGESRPGYFFAEHGVKHPLSHPAECVRTTSTQS